MKNASRKRETLKGHQSAMNLGGVGKCFFVAQSMIRLMTPLFCSFFGHCPSETGNLVVVGGEQKHENCRFFRRWLSIVNVHVGAI